jgi:hypothetical protein
MREHILYFGLLHSPIALAKDLRFRLSGRAVVRAWKTRSWVDTLYIYIMLCYCVCVYIYYHIYIYHTHRLLYMYYITLYVYHTLYHIVCYMLRLSTGLP